MIEYKKGDILHEDAEALVNTVNCVGAVVRHEAAFVLGRLRRLDSNLIVDEEFLALCKSARSDPSIIVRHEATEVLGKLEGPRVVAMLHELAVDENPDVAITAQLGLEHHVGRER